MTTPFALVFGIPILAAVALLWFGRRRSSMALLRSFSIALIPGTIAGAVATYFADEMHSEAVTLPDFYGSTLRGSLFSGFLSLGGFLLSLKTFIVVKMKEGVYDQPWYRERFEQQRIAHPKKAITLFGALGRLRSLLFWSIVASLLTAVLQVTLGLVKNDLTVAIVLAMPAIALGFLVQSLIRINSNLRQWFEYMEQDAEQKRNKARENSDDAENSTVPVT